MRRAEPVAGLGGVLLLGALFLPWYRFKVPEFGGEFFGPEAVDGTSVDLIGQGEALITTLTLLAADVNGWRAFTAIDVLLALLALLAIAVPIVSLLAKEPAKPIAIAVIASTFGWIAVLLVGFRLVDAPAAHVELRYGAWVALAGALIAWTGSWLSLRDESTPGAVLPDIPRRPAPATG